MKLWESNRLKNKNISKQLKTKRDVTIKIKSKINNLKKISLKRNKNKLNFRSKKRGELLKFNNNFFNRKCRERMNKKSI